VKSVGRNHWKILRRDYPENYGDGEREKMAENENQENMSMFSAREDRKGIKIGPNRYHETLFRSQRRRILENAIVNVLRRSIPKP